MDSTHLNEHDANQGAQSSGEFLGMTGNSGWYLLGSGGATILMVIFLWGILGVSLLLCLLVGVVLCMLSVAYVFTLKNNKPEHYDTDFFESALVESGVLQFCFGPRARRPVNCFACAGMTVTPAPAEARRRALGPVPATGRRRVSGPVSAPAASEPVDGEPQNKASRTETEPTVPRAAYERLQENLTAAEEMLEDALGGAVED